MLQPPPLPTANPYAAPLAPVEIHEARDVVLAGRGARFGAAVLDNLFVVATGMVAAIFLPSLERSGNQTAMAVLVGLALLGFLTILAVNVYFLHRNGQTIGKKIVGIRVVRSDTSPVELWRYIVLRVMPISLLGAIPLLGPVIALIDALMIFGEERRCLHDLIADTIVVDV